MSLFKDMTTDGLEETQDRLGGGQHIFETDIYTGTIKAMYAGQSQSGAHNITLIVDFGGKEYRETIYYTNKNGKNYFFNKDDPTKKVPLPGFTVIDDICLSVTGAPLCEQATEEKVVKVWNFDAKKEEPKAVPMITAALGKTISLGVVKQLENKATKQGDEYVPTTEVRTSNYIDKVFHTESKMTVVEAKAGKTEGEFWDAWLKRNQGQERDKRTIKDGEGGAAGRPAPRSSATPPQAGGSGAAPRKSLFGK